MNPNRCSRSAADQVAAESLHRRAMQTVMLVRGTSASTRTSVRNWDGARYARAVIYT